MAEGGEFAASVPPSRREKAPPAAADRIDGMAELGDVAAPGFGLACVAGGGTKAVALPACGEETGEVFFGGEPAGILMVDSGDVRGLGDGESRAGETIDGGQGFRGGLRGESRHGGDGGGERVTGLDGRAEGGGDLIAIGGEEDRSPTAKEGVKARDATALEAILQLADAFAAFVGLGRGPGGGVEWKRGDGIDRLEAGFGSERVAVSSAGRFATFPNGRVYGSGVGVEPLLGLREEREGILRVRGDCG